VTPDRPGACCAGGVSGDRDQQAVTSGRRLVYLAAERTLLSWIRTALSLMALGFVVDRFDIFLAVTMARQEGVGATRHSPYWLGVGIVGFGAVVAAVGAVRYWRFGLRYHRQGRTEPGRGVLFGVIGAALVALAGAGIVILLLGVGRAAPS
jgi:putative membrane protein